MITLFGFGPAFGLPDPSPFVMKTEVQLKMAGLPYRWERAAPPSAPKGKIPYIEDEGVLIADSTFIRLHIETAYGIDFDRRLSPEQKAMAWAAERVLEDHIYFALLQARWMDDANFAKGPRISSTVRRKACARRRGRRRAPICTATGLAVIRRPRSCSWHARACRAWPRCWATSPVSAARSRAARTPRCSG